MEHLTMQDLEDLGFKLVKSYEHGNFMTQRREKGCITLKTTWQKNGKFESQDITISDKCFELNPQEIQFLDLILNK